MPESTSTQSRDYNWTRQEAGIYPVYARININPVEGLQPSIWPIMAVWIWRPESTSTQSRDYNCCPTMPSSTSPCQNQHQPSRGITTGASQASRGNGMSQNQHQPSRGITTSQPGHQATVGGGPESTSTQSRDYNHTGVALAGWRNHSQNQHQPSRGITTCKFVAQ